MEEYGIMEYLELIVTRCGQWTGNRELIWSGLNDRGIIERKIVDKAASMVEELLKEKLLTRLSK